MKGYVYILRSQTSAKYYIGVTNNIARRLEEHNKGRTLSTRNKGPWKVMFKQEYCSIEEARKVEQRIKKLKRRDYIEKMIIQGCIKTPNGD